MKMILHWNKSWIYFQKRLGIRYFFLLTFAEQELSPFGQNETVHMLLILWYNLNLYF